MSGIYGDPEDMPMLATPQRELSPIEQLLSEEAARVAAERTRRSVMPMRGRDEGAVTKVMEGLPPAAARALWEAFTFPGRYARGETGYQPGQMASEQPEATQWVPEMALNMIGSPALAGGVPGVGSGVGKGIKAYHGSPHDFDRFDLSKIGTGEGAQVYGHGLYFAENPAVAQSYRDVLGGNLPYTTLSTGDQLPTWVAAHIQTADKKGIRPQGLEEMRREFMNRLAEFQAELKTSHQPWNVEGKIENMRSILGALDKLEKGATINPRGRMYEVNINAAPEQFLDWDKPLAGQAPEVVKSVRGVVMDAARKPAPMDGLRAYERAIIKGEDDRRALTGADAYAHLGRRFGDADAGVWTERNRAAASAALRDAGIPGIKYLDQGSRGFRVQGFFEGKPANDVRVFSTEREANQWADYLRSQGLEVRKPEATSNYVVFDDKLIDILRKYGIALPVGGLGGLGVSATQELVQ